MNETYILLTSDRGFIVRRTDDRIIFRYRRLDAGKYLYGDVFVIPVELLKKILEDPRIIELMLK